MHQPHRLSLLCLTALCFLLLAGSFASPSSADEPLELVVLLAGDPASPQPADVVAAINSQKALPGLLGVGEPSAARFLLPFRAKGELAEHLAKNPDLPRARLERYLVITYLSKGALEAAQEALRTDATILSVGPNGRFEISAVPNDPYFPNTGDPSTYQWGAHLLNLPSAWDWTTGHAYIGIADVGIQGQDASCGLPGGENGHPDLRAFQQSGSAYSYKGGSFRQSLSRDLGNPNQGTPDTCVDELQPEVIGGLPRTATYAGHGTHVAGIVAATSNNSLGISGTSWFSSLMIAKFSHLVAGFNDTWLSVNDHDDIAASICWLVDKGAQVINLTVAGPSTFTCSPVPSEGAVAICEALSHAASRDVTVIASSGNFRGAISFPARDPRVLAVGGVSPSGVLWDEPANSVGSNYGPEQDLAAPAAGVVSTFYENRTWNPNPGVDCTDSNFSPLGYGRCTGTSMASPFVSGIAGLIRSTNPLLTAANVRQSLTSKASQAGSWTPQLGFGLPNAAASVIETLGKAGGLTPVNRLTPLFSLYGFDAEDHFYTSVPQMASAAIEDIDGAYYVSTGPSVPGYNSYPGIPPCQVSPCVPILPTASVYLFTTEKTPIPGKTLAPLYRMSFRGANGSNVENRDTYYTVEAPAGIQAARSVGYQLDGIEGFVFATCGTNTSCLPDASCSPPGTVALLQRYNAARDDHAIFPESELPQYQAAGYTLTSGRACLGYVYPNNDSDGDTLISGYENLLGTNPSVGDSDCDGLSDGQEVLGYPPTDPRGAPGCKSAQIMNQSVSSTMIAGHQYAVSLTVKNSGSITWNPIGPQCNAYRLAQVGSAGWSPIRVELPASLAAGQQVTLNFNVVAPATSGTYNFQVRMVHECVEFFGDLGPNVAVSVQALPKQAKFIAQSVPTNVTAGQPYSASVTFANTGTVTWNPIGPQCNAYRLAQIGNSAWSPIRAELPVAIAPGQQVTLTLSGNAPSTPGQYSFQTRVVHECVEFFGDLSPQVMVTVSP